MLLGIAGCEIVAGFDRDEIEPDEPDVGTVLNGDGAVLGGGRDAATQDSGLFDGAAVLPPEDDAEVVDEDGSAEVSDAESADAGLADGGDPDAGELDASAGDAGDLDAGDATASDAAIVDAAQGDAGDAAQDGFDAGDAGLSDAAVTDAAVPDAAALDGAVVTAGPSVTLVASRAVLAL
jgi:ATP-dependent RNA helicase DeaD